MTPAERLRAAAERIRETAEWANEGTWSAERDLATGMTKIVTDSLTGSLARDIVKTDAEHIALWSPPVAVAVADILGNEGAYLASVDQRPDLHSTPNMARTELLLALADLILGAES